MALAFDNNSVSSDVTIAADASINDWVARTVLLWVYPTEPAHAVINRIFDKGFYFTAGGVVGNTGIRMQVARSSPHAVAEAELGTLEIDKWLFFAGTYDETDGPRIFKGTLETEVAEVTYDSRTVGTGATQADASRPIVLGNNTPPESPLGYRGRIGRVAYVNKRLALAEIQRLQFAPISAWRLPETGLLLDCQDATVVRDLSGNGNHGTPTNVTVADHLPVF